MRSKSHSWAKVGKSPNGAIRVIATLRLRGSARRAWKPDHHVLCELGPHSNEIDATGVLYTLSCKLLRHQHYSCKRHSRDSRDASQKAPDVRSEKDRKTVALDITEPAYTFHYNRQITWPFQGHGKKIALTPKAKNVQCRAVTTISAFPTRASPQSSA